MDSTEIHFLEPVELTLRDFPVHGPILDVGGGGEGMIGRLKERDVVAIDLREDELLEAPDGPLKTVMDARALAFPDRAFATATAFFSFMYVDGEADQQAVFNEIYRALRPGGHLHLWDIDLSERPETEKSVFAIPVKCRIRDRGHETGYYLVQRFQEVVELTP